MVPRLPPFVGGCTTLASPSGAHHQSDPQTAGRRRVTPPLPRRRLTAAQIADHFATTAQHVLRDLHDAGVPVRPGGARPLRGAHSESIRLLADLYRDPAVIAVLDAHGVPHRRHAGRWPNAFLRPYR